jgi:hypothetical protein
MMDNLRNQAGQRYQTPTSADNQLWHYVQSMDVGIIDRLSKPDSDEVQQVMDRHIASLLGHLPAGEFGVMVSTSRENLAHLLSAAMLNGYFLRAVEQRMAFEQLIPSQDTPSTADPLDFQA